MMWKAKGVPQYDDAGYPKHQEDEETSPNRNHTITLSEITYFYRQSIEIWIVYRNMDLQVCKFTDL